MPIVAHLQENRQAVLALAARYGVHNVRVFGSVARGEADESSDYDLVVELPPGCGLFEHAALIGELQTLLGRRVDVVSDRGLKARIREQILAEAVPL